MNDMVEVRPDTSANDQGGDASAFIALIGKGGWIKNQDLMRSLGYGKPTHPVTGHWMKKVDILGPGHTIIEKSEDVRGQRVGVRCFSPMAAMLVAMATLTPNAVAVRRWLAFVGAQAAADAVTAFDGETGDAAQL